MVKVILMLLQQTQKNTICASKRFGSADCDVTIYIQYTLSSYPSGHTQLIWALYETHIVLNICIFLNVWNYLQIFLFPLEKGYFFLNGHPTIQSPGPPYHSDSSTKKKINAFYPCIIYISFVSNARVNCCIDGFKTRLSM